MEKLEHFHSNKVVDTTNVIKTFLDRWKYPFTFDEYIVKEILWKLRLSLN